jgi:hypothetical protein
MHALIVSTNGEDAVYVAATREKVDKKAIEIIRGEIDLDSASWENFGNLEVEKLLMEALEHSEVDSAMELFADISDVRGEIVFMRIVKAEVEFDS